MRTITIGRSSQCDIILSDGSISRVHAEISINNGQYVYTDKSSNGSNIGGQIISNKKVVVAPGVNILLANMIPLPWDRVYTLLPISNYRVNETETMYRMNNETLCSSEASHHHGNGDYSQQKIDKLGIGLGVLAFLIPFSGWIMYFSWKDETPNKANLAGIIGSISFIINIMAFCA